MDYIISAVHHVADHGYKFLPYYRFNAKTGEWRHHSHFGRAPGRRWLASFDFERLFSSDNKQQQQQQQQLPSGGGSADGNTNRDNLGQDGLEAWGCRTEVELFDRVSTLVVID